MSLKPLPINTAYTVHEILIPSQGKKLRFRPFLVKENKMLMIAQASEDTTQMLETLKAIIGSCCVEEHPLDVDKLATFDFEYLLIKLRSISIDHNVELNVTCSDPHSGFEQSTRTTQLLLDLDNIEIVGLENYSTKVKLSDDLFVIMKVPSLEMLDSIPDIENYKDNLSMVAAQLDKICTTEEVFDCSEYSLEQVEQWLEQLTSTQLENLLAYFQSIPYCRIKVEWTCPHCGKRNVRYIEGITYFL